MSNLSMFCLTLDPSHGSLIKKLSYIPVGLGNEKFPSYFLKDNEGENVSKKNLYYGEYTFHYWIWKNHLKNIKTEWVGFCQYRKFFVKETVSNNDLSFENLKKISINSIDQNDLNYQCILGKKFSVENFKLSKIIKNHLKEFLLNPKLIFNKKFRSLKFHFDLFHGKGNLDLAINQLDDKNKNDFRNYMNKNTAFNPHNMFICKREILEEYYNVIFPWLEKCEKIFGFDNLNSYGTKRIYGFLAERFLSFWFLKHFNVKESIIIGKDLSDYK